MKNFAKLILFFTLVFIIIFVSVTCLKYLSLKVDWEKTLPPKPETALTLIIASAHWALVLTLFSSILLTLNYVARREFFPLTSIITVMVLAIVFSLGIFHALNQMHSLPPSRPAEQTTGAKSGEKGLILSNSVNRNVTAVILLDGTANPYGPRVTVIPGQPLAFYESPPGSMTNFELPPIPFGGDTPWFLKSLYIDIRLNSEMLRQKHAESFVSYLIYAGSLIFLLCALGYVIKFSAWPLANLFLAALAFRGVLILGTFLNTPEIQEIIVSFLNNKTLISLALPLSFIGFSILIFIYSLLTFAAKRRKTDGD